MYTPPPPLRHKYRAPGLDSLPHLPISTDIYLAIQQRQLPQNTPRTSNTPTAGSTGTQIPLRSQVLYRDFAPHSTVPDALPVHDTDAQVPTYHISSVPTVYLHVILNTYSTPPPSPPAIMGLLFFACRMVYLPCRWLFQMAFWTIPWAVAIISFVMMLTVALFPDVPNIISCMSASHQCSLPTPPHPTLT